VGLFKNNSCAQAGGIFTLLETSDNLAATAGGGPATVEETLGAVRAEGKLGGFGGAGIEPSAGGAGIDPSFGAAGGAGTAARFSGRFRGLVGKLEPIENIGGAGSALASSI